MFVLDVISRILHVATAITLVGGSVFSVVALLPAVRSVDEAARAGLVEAIRSRWKGFVHGGIAIFLLTGFYNYFRAIPLHRGDGLYHGLMGIKMLIAFVIFFLAAALVGRSAGLQRIRDNRLFWSTVVVVLAAVIVAVSGFLKVRGGTP